MSEAEKLERFKIFIRFLKEMNEYYKIPLEDRWITINDIIDFERYIKIYNSASSVYTNYRYQLNGKTSLEKIDILREQTDFYYTILEKLGLIGKCND